MIYCYCCERIRDNNEFQNGPGGRKGKNCWSCLARYANSPRLMRVTGLGWYMPPNWHEPDGDYSIPSAQKLMFGLFMQQYNKERSLGN